MDLEGQPALDGLDDDLRSLSAERKALAAVDAAERIPPSPWVQHSHRHDNWLLPLVEQFIEANPMPRAEAEKTLARLCYNCPYDWSEVEPWLRRRNPRVGHDYLTLPEVTPLRCPFCLQPMRWIYWQNDVPSEGLCGTGGFVEVCVRCTWWARYDGRWMS